MIPVDEPNLSTCMPPSEDLTKLLRVHITSKQSMTKTGKHKRKIDGIDTTDRPAKMATGEKPFFGNCVAPSVGISGDAIPAPIWGRVMECLYYTVVLKCLMVNRTLSFEAPKYVKMIAILKSCEVEHLPLVKNRRRFENVKVVDILCLVVQDSTDADSHILCTGVINKIVPFLEVFPRISQCYLGGLKQKDLKRYVLVYDAEDCVGPDDHASHFCSLIEQLAVAFERGTLPQDLILQGVFDGFDTETCGCKKDGDDECSLCSRILRAFPLNSLLQLHHIWGTSCYSNEHIEKLIRERVWSPQCLVSAKFRFHSEAVVELVGLDVRHTTYRKMFEMQQAKNPSYLYYLPRFKAKRLSLMIDLGIRKKNVGARGKETFLKV